MTDERLEEIRKNLPGATNDEDIYDAACELLAEVDRLRAQIHEPQGETA